jgi:altronate hydrolase
MKIASNKALADAKPHWIDFDPSVALREGQERADFKFLHRVADVASGAQCANGRAAQQAIAIWKRGVNL